MKIGSGATPRGGQENYKTEGISLIRSQNVLDFTFSKHGLAFIDERQANELSNVEVCEHDILLNITGDSVARVCQVPPNILPARVNQHVAIIRPKSEISDPSFLKYQLLSKEKKELLLGLSSSGATRNALTKAMIENLEISLPPLEEQRRIASILTALDDKIELNRRMNTTLEGIAGALWEEWFGKYVREGEETGTIGEIAQLKKTQIRPDDLSNEINYVGLEHIQRKNLSLFDWSSAEHVESNKYAFEEGDLLFGKLRPYFHKVCLAPIKGVCSTDILVIQAKSDIWFPFLVFHIFSEKFIAFTNASADGTRMPRTNWPDICKYVISLPSTNDLQRFNEVTAPILTKIIHNSKELNSLTHLRDTLLPRLMRGE